MRNEIESLAPAQLIVLVQFCKAAMLILNARMFTLGGLLMAFGLFGYAAWRAEYASLLAAAAFALMVFLPLQRMEARREISTNGGDNG